jgi:hypothetical protein
MSFKESVLEEMTGKILRPGEKISVKFTDCFPFLMDS